MSRAPSMNLARVWVFCAKFLWICRKSNKLWALGSFADNHSMRMISRKLLTIILFFLRLYFGRLFPKPNQVLLFLDFCVFDVYFAPMYLGFLLGASMESKVACDMVLSHSGKGLSCWRSAFLSKGDKRVSY